MASIKYSNIINSFVSTEGAAGFMTNYIYYSVLVVYTDGTAEIVEGKSDKIAPFLRYLRTPVDELQEIKQVISQLPSEIGTISGKIDEKMDYVFDTIYPIPDICGMKEEDALLRIEECGFVPHVIQSDGISNGKGVIRFCQRNRQNFKCVDIGIIHDVPAVDGFTKDAAVEALELAGFQVRIKYVLSKEKEKDVVLHCNRMDDKTPVVELEVGSFRPRDEKFVRFVESIDSATRFQVLAAQWKEYGLDENPIYAEFGKKIQSKAELERLRGPNPDHREIKEFIHELQKLIT